MDYFRADYLGLSPTRAGCLNISQASLQIPEDRESRWKKIAPVFKTLRDGVMPSIINEDIPLLLETLKEEGNTFYRNKNFFYAYDMYTCAICIITVWKQWVFVNIDVNMVSTFFSNRAACLLKMDYFKACVDDCAVAITLNIRNLKAHFRKAQALKLLFDYVGAKVSAESGWKMAQEGKNSADLNEFNELLQEINSHHCSEVGLVKPEQGINGKDFYVDVPAERVLSEDRQKWWNRFEFIRSIVWDCAAVSLNISADILHALMEEMAEEACNLLDERNYHVAYDLFSGVHILAKRLQVDHFKEIDQPFLSKTFLTRAICAQKMDFFDQALNDCDLSLHLDQHDAMNILYRKALILKAKKCFREAFDVAVECRQKALERNNSNIVKLCDILICESDSHLLHLKKVVDSIGADIPVAVLSEPVAENAEAGAEKKNKRKRKKRWKKKDSADEENIVSAGHDENEIRASDGGQGEAGGTNCEILYKRIETDGDSNVAVMLQSMMEEHFDSGMSSNLASSQKTQSVNGVSSFSLQKSNLSVTKDLYKDKIDSLLQPSNSSVSFPSKTNATSQGHKSATDSGFGQSGEEMHGPVIIESDSKSANRPLVLSADKFSSKPRDLVGSSLPIQKANSKCSYPFTTVGMSPKQAEKSTVPRSVDCRQLDFAVTEESRHISKETIPKTISGLMSNSSVSKKMATVKQEPHIPNDVECAMFGLSGAAPRTPVSKKNVTPELSVSKKLNNKTSNSKPPSAIETINANMEPVAIKAPVKSSLLPLNELSMKPQKPSDKQTVSKLVAVQPSKPFQNFAQVEASSKAAYKKQEKKTHSQDSVRAVTSQGNSSRALCPLPAPSLSLDPSCTFRLACSVCFKENSAPLSVDHRCCEDILVVQNKTSKQWLVVRECKHQSRSGASYMMCWHVSVGNKCPRGINCTFAHNVEELKLWNLQKEGFRIDAFISDNRSAHNLSGYTVEAVYRKYGGELRMICGSCYKECNRIFTQNLGNTLCDVGKHELRFSKHLAHRAKSLVTMIGKRPMKGKNAYFNLCYQKQFCRKKVGCICAHSEIERDIWYVERDTGLIQDAIISEWYQLSMGCSQSQMTMVIGNSSAGSVSGRVTLVSSTAVSSSFPFKVTKVCSVCLKNGSLTENAKGLSKCTSGHSWNLNAVFLILPSKKVVKELPRHIPFHNNFRICNFVNDCHLGNGCQFAHSSEEIKLWIWMIENKVKKLDDVIVKQLTQMSVVKRSSSLTNLVDRQSSSSNSPPWAISSQTNVSPFLGQEQCFYCYYCGIPCNSQTQLELHCSSPRHILNVNSDSDKQWNFHQPPWNVQNGSYRLCIHHLEGRCRFSNVPASSNMCTFAHSQEELDEWIERYKWRAMKRKLAVNENLFSYMDRLIEEFNESGDSVLSDEVKDVSVLCSNSLSLFVESKSAEKQWTFQLKSQPGLLLKKVALLYHDHRLHFFLKTATEKSSQLAQGDVFRVEECVYEVKVCFKGGIYGSFSQSVVFDFGRRPLLVRKISVELGQQNLRQKVKELRENLHLDRWTPSNRTIITLRNTARITDEFDEGLLAKYKAPTSTEIMQEVIGFELNQHNYKFKMHGLLKLEEMTQTRIIFGYNVIAKVQVKNCVGDDMKGFRFAQQGELYAQVPLTSQLIEGGLVSTSVTKVLIAPKENQTKSVYEAVITELENQTLKGYDYVFLTLSAECCKGLALKSGDEQEMEVQFQIDRSTFCRLHYSVDQLRDVKLVFPDICKLHLTFGQEYKMDYSSSKLNEDQRKILDYISNRRQNFPPPLVVYGPFGTGKTETMAEAAILLAANNAVKILICTLTNQAADEYILRHFDPLLSCSSCPPFEVLRVYDKLRKVATIDVVARKYSLLSSDTISFREPTKDDILSRKVIVTTLGTSPVLSKLNLRGNFTHIFIDEAAQVNECRTLMPLCLADDKTCIILAGDHIQMVDPIYSDEAKEQKFHLSLVERLMNMYMVTANIQNPPKVLLKMNYRNHREIVRFVAKVFYAGEDSLVPKNSQPDLAGFPPLAFFAAIGCEDRFPNSTSFYNEAETMEVVEQVKYVYEKWPKEWGERRPDQILVTSPYGDQIQQIRNQLRRQPNRDLQRVNVLRVQNVPGREFRAVIISTVRTRNILKSENLSKLPDDADYGFLSDCKMLNSAFTRAKSYLAVVGDPVALCSIGTCSKIWHQYFKFCSLRPGGINPTDLTLDTIRMQCDAFMAPLEITSRSTRNDRNAKTKKEDEEQFDVSEIIDLEDWNRDYHLEPDDIIRQLVTQELQVSHGSQFDGNFPRNEFVSIENIRLQEREGHALLDYRRPESQRTLISATTCENDYDSLSDEDNEADSIHTNQEPRMLKSLLKTQPQKYKRCTITIESSKSIFARPLDKPFDFKQVKITSRRLCGHAFSGDEVVVEILRVGVMQGKKTDEKVAYGQVIGVLRQFMNPQYRMFVCTVEEGNTGIMVPINKSIPKLYNLESKTRIRNSPNEVTVYRFMNGGEIRFDRFEKVNQYDTVSKLFVVRFLKWEPKFTHPLGIVVKVIPSGNMVSEAMPIIEIEHNIPRRFRTETEREVQQLFPPNYQFSKAVLKNRVDYRKKLVFTIDPAESTDLDDALSFEELSPGCYEVGIHIADVSYFLNLGRKIDEEARQRGSTFYQAAGEAIHMLPSRLSSDLCSLLPNQDRLTMSVIMTIDDAVKIQTVEVKRCVICSQFRLSYEQVESIIKGEQQMSGSEISQELKVKVMLLNSIAQEWRRRRLGNRALHHSVEPEYLQSARAHLLIEEFMVAANHQVAQLLVRQFPQLTPLRNQLPPNEIELDEWRQHFQKEAGNSVALTWPFMPKGSICNCVSNCTHVPSRQNDNEKFELKKCVWHDILATCADDNTELLRTLVVSPEYHPQLSVALLYLHFLSEKSQYVCSGDISVDEHSHFSLNLTVYTHFTSPIRRYLDVLVHRLLGNMIDGCKSDYSQADISELCLRCTDAIRRSNKFQEASQLAHICQLLQQRPIVVLPVIEKVDESIISLYCPTLHHLFSQKLKMRTAWLQPSEKPNFEADRYETLLRWSQRIYDPLHKKSADHSNHTVNGTLNADRHILKANSDQWKKVLESVLSPDVEINQIAKILSSLERTMVDPVEVHPEQDPCSEDALARFAKHFSDFSMLFRQSGIVKVQLSVELIRGLLLPSVQLLSLTNLCSICVEHRKNPVACFASTTARKATRSVYGDVEEYQDLWLPVLAIEAASSAVSNDIPAIIRNVEIDWREGWTARRTKSYAGIFKLGANFCKDRSLKFPLSGLKVDEDAISFRDEDACSGYFCVQYANIQKKTPNTELDLFGVKEIDDPYTWVGHCNMVRSSIDEDVAVVTVQLQLNSGSSPLPTELLGKHDDHLATVEWISKPLPDWRMENAVTHLGEAGNLAQCIALGRSPKPLDHSYLQMVLPWMDREVPGLQPANITQRNGIKQALKESFFLIQGPPGTGKTIVAVNLAYTFCQINKTLSDRYNNKSLVRPQVMCCGPSNKSVDVIAGYLMRLKIPDIVIIRVYSEKVAKEDFPIPHRVLLIKKKFRLEDRVHDTALREISLHHMIRSNRWNPSSARYLLEMDERIRNNPDSVSEEQVAEYTNTISEAENVLLRQAHIILLTCSSSGAPRFRTAGVNVLQLIVDECGMCMEPENLIPIVNSRAKQVILLGDHQQLQPIVLDSGALRRGLGQSMFERYAKNAHMLTTQYRMHKAIAEFPSKQFYHDKLEVGRAEQSVASWLTFWPAGGTRPIAFVHVEGREDALAVETEEGGEQSKMNEEEIKNVVFIVRQMVEMHRIEAKSIAVLSQYRAQSTELSKKFQKGSAKFKDVTVQTVVAAQGSEWDYVLLSTVRSLPEIEIERRPSLNWKRKHLGFVADPHQINVAITRARKGLIIVGNRHLLECDDVWKALIKHYEESRKLVDSSTFRSLLGGIM